MSMSGAADRRACDVHYLVVNKRRRTGGKREEVDVRSDSLTF